MERQEQDQSSKRKMMALIIAFVAFALMIAATTISFVWWQNVVKGNNKDDSQNVTIGSGGAINTTVDVTGNVLNGNKLVPTWLMNDSTTQTDEVEIEFNVTWVDANNFNAYKVTEDLKVAVTEIEVDGSTTYTDVNNSNSTENWENVKGLDATGAAAELFNIDLSGAQNQKITLNDANAVVITIKLKLNEPKDEEMYNAIAGKSLKITLNFSVADSTQTRP